MWGKEGNLLVYKDSSFFISTTTREFFEDISTAENLLKNKEPLHSCLSKEKNLILFSFLDKYGFRIEKTNFLLCEQIHEDKIVFVEHLDENRAIKNLYNKRFFVFEQADGILTTINDTIIIVFTADCIPLFVFNKNSKIFGLIHIGRKGLERGISERFFNLLNSKNLDIDGFYFVFGPHICGNCYEVDGKNYSMYDRLIEVFTNFGVNQNKIVLSKYCTYHSINPNFFSYRKDKTNMRNLSVIYPK